MTKVTKEAKEAFTKSFQPAHMADRDLGLIAMVRMFLETLKEVSPEVQFTSGNIKLWAKEYVKNAGSKSSKIDLADWAQINNYAIGRFLKNNIGGDLGYTQVGSYGNRAVYSLIDDNKLEGE